MCLSFKALHSTVYGQPWTGFEMISEAERLALDSGNPRAMSTFRFFRSMLERWLGRPANAMQFIDPVVSMARVLGRQRLILALAVQGLALGETGKIEKAMASLKEAIDLSEKFGIPQRLGVLHNTLGYCYGEICLPETAWWANMESRELAERQMKQFPIGIRGYAEMRAQASVNLMENLFDQGKVDEAQGTLESFKEESIHEVYDMFRHQWTSRMNYLETQILLLRGDIDHTAAVIEENLQQVRRTHSKKREGCFLRLLGEVQIRRGESDSAITAFNDAIVLLKEVGNPRQLWQAYDSLGSAYQTMGRPGEARQQWSKAAEVIQTTANGLSDRELREGFLSAAPIKNILFRCQ
jgi:tetratricopeptide (TPR) repeat protein